MKKQLIVPSTWIYLLAAACLLISDVIAQTGAASRLTLNEAVSRAREKHPLIIASRRRVTMAEFDLLEAGKRPNPTLYFSGENFPLGSTRNGFDFGSSIDWFATYSHTFETAGKRRLRVSTAETGLEATRAESLAIERRVVFEVKSAYQLASFARLRLELLRQNLDNINQIVSLNEIRVREGYTAEGDLIKVRLEAQRNEYELRKAALDYEMAKIGILRAIGGSGFDESDLNFEPAEELDFRPVSINLRLLQDSAMQLPQVKSAIALVERARSAVRLERARAAPDLTANFGYKRNGPDNTLFAAVSIPLPIYNRHQAVIARAEAEVEVAEAELGNIRNQVLSDLAAARRSLEMNQATVSSIRADFLLRADESRNISLAAYREGAVDLLILLDAQRVRSQAQELYFKALYDYQISIHELERAAGIESLPGVEKGTQKAEN